MTESYRLLDGTINFNHPDLPVHLIPSEKVPPEELGIVAQPRVEYAAVPLSCWSVLRPPERLFMALHFAHRTWKPDEDGGWYRLSSGLYTRAGLENRETRRRAVDFLCRAGVVEIPFPPRAVD